MKANRFYSVPFDARNNTKVLKFQLLTGKSKPEAYGLWQILLGVLYDENGSIRLDDEINRRMLATELDTDEMQLDGLLRDFADAGLIDKTMLEERGCVTSMSVCDELQYREDKSNAGKASARSRAKKNGDKATKKTKDLTAKLTESLTER